MPWPLTPEEDGDLDRANGRAWQTPSEQLKRHRILTGWRRQQDWAHEPDLYRVSPPPPGRVIDQVMREAQFDRKLARLWDRKHFVAQGKVFSLTIG